MWPIQDYTKFALSLAYFPNSSYTRQQLVISTAGSNTIRPYVKHSPKQGTSNDSVTSPLVKPPSSSSTLANLDLTLRIPFRPIKDKKTQESLARIIFSSLFFILFTMTCSHARSHAHSHARGSVIFIKSPDHKTNSSNH